MPRENREPQEMTLNAMKPKESYYTAEGIDRVLFHNDIKMCARSNGMPVPSVLRMFFDSAREITNEEKGSFALCASAKGDIVNGTVILIHALGITKDMAATENVMVNYVKVNDKNPETYANSFQIDSMMCWPEGTVLPASQKSLEAYRKK